MVLMQFLVTLTLKIEFFYLSILISELRYAQLCFQDEKSVENLRALDILRRHIKRSKKVRAR